MILSNFVSIKYVVVSICFLADVRYSYPTSMDASSPKQSRGLLSKILKPNQCILKDRDLVAEGVEFFTQKKYKEAIISFTRAIRNTPRDPSYYVLRAKCYLQKKFFQMALTDFKMAIFLTAELGQKETSSLDPTYLTYLGNKFLKRKKFKEAHWCLTESIVRINPPSVLLHKIYGDSCRGIGDYEKVALEYKKALKMDQNDEVARKALILSLLKVEEIDEAITNIFALDEKNIFSYGEAFFEKDRFTEALRCLNKVIEKNSQDERYFELRGKTHVRLGSLNLALSNFEKQTRLSPTNFSGWFFLIETLRDPEKIDQIIKETQVLNDKQLYGLGKLFLDEGKLQEALCLFDEAIKQNSSVASHLRERGLCHSKMENWNLAVLDLKKGVEMDPNLEDMYLYRSALSESLYATGKHEEAVKEMILALQAMSTSRNMDYRILCGLGEKLDDLANKLSSNNEFVLAIRCYTGLIENEYLANNLRKYRLQRGICHRKLKNYDEAILDNIDALERGGLDPDDSLPILFDVFELLIEAERYEEALDVVEVVETFYPDSLDSSATVSDSSTRITAARKKIGTIQEQGRGEANNKGRINILSAILKLHERDEEKLDYLARAASRVQMSETLNNNRNISNQVFKMLNNNRNI